MTAKEIRDSIGGMRRVYIREFATSSLQRVFDARMFKGELQVKTAKRWHTVLNGDEVYAVDC